MNIKISTNLNHLNIRSESETKLNPTSKPQNYNPRDKTLNQPHAKHAINLRFYSTTGDPEFDRTTPENLQQNDAASPQI